MVSAALLLALSGDRRLLGLSPERSVVLALPVLVVALLLLRGAYRTRLRMLALDWLLPVVSAVSVATMATAMLALLIDGRLSDPRAWLRVWLLTLVAVSSGRAILALAHRWARTRRLVAKPVLIMGTGVIGARLARRLEAQPEYGLSPVGFLDDGPQSTTDIGPCNVPMLGSLDAVDEVLSKTGARNLIVAFSGCPDASGSPDARISAIIRRCQQRGVEVSVVPRMFDTINDRIRYEAVGGLPLLSFRMVDRAGWQFAVKHALDRLIAGALLVALSPLMIAIAVAVRLTSPGPIIFRQQRLGRDGKLFDLYKFRSMVWQEPRTTSASVVYLAGGHVANDLAPGGLEGDKRLTRIGGMLRNLSLDELPQFINVLKGDMSIVGPRPERPEFVALFERNIARYGERHWVKCGITGWAQVHGLRGPTSLTDRTEWDNYYIAHWSFGLDFKILVLTAVALIRGR